MKHGLWLATMLLLSPAVTLAGKDSSQYTEGGFGGPTLHFTQIDNNSTWGLGGKGAWLKNHSYYIGGGGFNTFIDTPDIDGIMQHEGLILGYIGRPQQTIHYTLELLLGIGQLMTDEPHSDTDYLLAMEPQANLSITLSSFAVFNLGISYRLISESNHNVLTNSKLSGISTNLNVMFGDF